MATKVELIDITALAAVRFASVLDHLNTAIKTWGVMV